MDERRLHGGARCARASGHLSERYSEPFVAFLPVTGAAVSTLGDVLGSETLSASDAHAARLDEVQFDLGEGPCWDALRSAQADRRAGAADGAAPRGGRLSPRQCATSR